MLVNLRVISLCLLSLFFMNSVGASTVSEMYRTQALFSFSDKAYDDALKMLNLAVQDDASDGHARYYRGVTLSRLGRYQAAAEDLKLASAYNLPYKDLLFELGFAYYRAEQLDQAQLALQAAVDGQPNHAASNYYLGLVYYQNKHYQESLKPLQVAARLSDEFGGVASYLRGQSLVNLQRNSEARQVLEMAVNRYPDSVYVNPSRELLARIGSAKDSRRFKVNVSLGWGYDSNVGLFPDPDKPTVGTIGKGDDVRTQLGLAANYRLFDNQQYALSAGYRLFQSLHQDLDIYDVQNHALSLDLRRRLASGSVGVTYQMSKSLLGGNNYLLTNTINPYFIQSHEGSRLSMLRLTWRNNNYLNTGTGTGNRDGKVKIVHYRHYWINEANQQNRVYLGGKWQDEGSGDATVAYKVVNAEIGAQRLWRKIRMNARASIERKDYYDSPLGRIDKRRDLSLGVTMPVAKDLEFEVLASYTWNPSNQTANDYNRRTIFGTLRWQP
ncbi:MAG: tetratricopeptide repeat protein [Gammaproteobacteria bacterium]|nr:tetratricopeptide repeat protein [Gammaproteobacteria bacterium]